MGEKEMYFCAWEMISGEKKKGRGGGERRGKGL